MAMVPKYQLLCSKLSQLQDSLTVPKYQLLCSKLSHIQDSLKVPKYQLLCSKLSHIQDSLSLILSSLWSRLFLSIVLLLYKHTLETISPIMYCKHWAFCLHKIVVP